MGWPQAERAMDTATRNRLLDQLVDAIGPGPFNRLIGSKEATQVKGRLRFWQEELFRRAGVEVTTVEEFLDLLEGAEPRSIPPPPPLTKDDFLREATKIWYSNRRDEVPLDWFGQAWRDVPAFRGDLSYELIRYARKLGELLAPDLLPVLAAVLTGEEVVSLYKYVRDHAGRESEWRREFEVAFPAHVNALPPLQIEMEPVYQGRLDYSHSIRRIRQLGLPCLEPEKEPPMPDHVPQPDDAEPLGLSFFRTLVGEGANLSNLTIPRTFFGRSEISNASFRNTDLSESNLRWNDFIDVDFTEAILARADCRASIYTRVRFARADLRGADMRRADFEECIFDGALMDGTVLTRNQGSRLSLSGSQQAAIAWCNDDGPEPSGG